MSSGMHLLLIYAYLINVTAILPNYVRMSWLIALSPLLLASLLSIAQLVHCQITISYIGIQSRAETFKTDA